MIFLFSFCLLNSIFAQASQFDSHPPHVSLFYQNSSKKAYLLHQAEQRYLKEKSKLALKKRQKQLRNLRKAKQLKNKIEELELQSYLYPDKIPSLNQKLSQQEEAFWDHQNQIRLIETGRKKAFLQYKKQYAKDKERKKSLLQTRLKRTNLLRQKLKSRHQTTEVSPFESF